jgi:two-component system CheB/CheR fusion protein
MCVFSTHDLVKDPPFSKLDMVSCRNLLIYFESALQQRVISTFHYGLKTNGLLWLGPSETLAASGRLFKPLDKRSRMFRRIDAAAEVPRPRSRSRMTAASASPGAVADSIDAQATRMIAQYAPAYIVFDSQHAIQRFSGSVEKFMQPVSGSASLDLFRMLHAQLRSPVRNLIRKAIEQQQPVQEQVSFQIAGKPHAVNLIAEPMAEPIGGQRCLMLAFQELHMSSTRATREDPDNADDSPDPGHGELVAAREKLQTITEELETANEELQSSNEEFQSVNEELHSTVEELETSKEELSSINEELQTVNAELNNRADNLVRSNSDLANLFDSTAIATLFLDNGSHIRRFTPAITEIFNVREGDEGRLISDFSSRLAGSALMQDIATVLRDLGSIEREAESDDGAATFLVRVKPYRDLNNVIDGVVVTLIDISDRKKLERDQAHLAAIVASSDDAIVSHDLDGTITSWNAGAEKIYGYKASEIIGQPMSTLLDEAQIDEWPDNLARLRKGQSITDIDISRVTKGDRVIYVSLNISPMCNAQGHIIGASAVARDIAMRKLAEERAKMLMSELDHRVKNILSVVSSLVSQTLKTGGTIEVVRAEIEGRIQAISRAHALLTELGGVEGALHELVSTELLPYANRANVSIAGDDVVLSSNANLSMALAVHELVTNSAKYGALSTEQGCLDFTWRVTETDSNLELQILWVETGGPPVVTPTRRGFGTKLIELSLVRGLNARVNRQFLASGVRCEIFVPLSADIGRLRSPTEKL